MCETNKNYIGSQENLSFGTIPSTGSTVVMDETMEESCYDKCLNEDKFIVFGGQLQQLFQFCQFEGCGCRIVTNFTQKAGVLCVNWCCNEGHNEKWTYR